MKPIEPACSREVVLPAPLDALQLGADAPREPPLTTRVVKGVAWVFAGKAVGRGMGLVKLIVLARLLTPEDFGLFGIVMLAIATIETFTETGFSTALIQRKGNIEDYLDTAWTVQVIRGLVLAAILFAVAPGVGWFFEGPRCVPLLRVMCISVAVGGFVNIGIIYFQKQLEFHKQVAYNLVSAVVSLVVGVVLAYKLRSVWALVWAGMAGAATRSLLSYAFHPYRPHPRFDGAQAAQMFRFGRWVLGTSVVVFLATHGDDALLGKMLGAAALGLYQIAYRFSNAPATEITHLTSAVMMPAYAKVQDDTARLGRAFVAVFEIVISLALPLTVFLVLAAPEIVLGLLGAKWEAAVGPLRILAVAGLLRAVAATGGPVFMGTGRPHMDFWMNLGRTLVIAVTVYPLTRAFGVAGTAGSVVCGLAATLPIWARVKSITEVSWTEILKRSASGVALGIVVVVGVCIARCAPFSSALRLLMCEVCVVAAFWSFTVWLQGRWFSSGLSVHAARAWSAIRPA